MSALVAALHLTAFLLSAALAGLVFSFIANASYYIYNYRTGFCVYGAAVGVSSGSGGAGPGRIQQTLQSSGNEAICIYELVAGSAGFFVAACALGILLLVVAFAGSAGRVGYGFPIWPAGRKRRSPKWATGRASLLLHLGLFAWWAAAGAVLAAYNPNATMTHQVLHNHAYVTVVLAAAWAACGLSAVVIAVEALALLIWWIRQRRRAKQQQAPKEDKPEYESAPPEALKVAGGNDAAKNAHVKSS